MFVFYAAAAAAAVCLCAATRPSDEPILMAAVDVEFPFLMGLMNAGEAADNVTVCTGTLVNSVFVLSSAYCTSRLRTGIEASTTLPLVSPGVATPATRNVLAEIPAKL